MYRPITLLVVLTYTAIPAANIELSPKAASFVSKRKPNRPSSYRLIQRPYGEARMHAMAQWLGGHGFSPQQQGEKSGMHFIQQGRDRELTYHPKRSTFRYVNRAAKAIGTTEYDHEGLRAVSDRLLGEITDGAEDYTFMNIELQQSRRYGEDERTIDYVIFRYVPRLAGRLVLGTSAHIKIKLGRDGELAGLTKAEPTIREGKQIGAEVTSESLAALVQSRTERDDFWPRVHGVPAKAKTVRLLSGTASYLSRKIAGADVLLPHVSFFTEADMTEYGEKPFRREVHVCVDGDRNKDAKEHMLKRYPANK